MVQNLIKIYSDFLELLHLNIRQRNSSLKKIFERDICEKTNFNFDGKIIRPLKGDDGQASMDTLFGHLTTEVDDVTGRRIFERKIKKIALGFPSYYYTSE